MKRLNCFCLMFVFPCTDVNVQPLSGGEKKKKKLKKKANQNAWVFFSTGIKWDMTADSFSAFPVGK